MSGLLGKMRSCQTLKVSQNYILKTHINVSKAYNFILAATNIKKHVVGGPEPWVPKIVAQRFGELLGQAMTAIRYLGPENDSRMLWPEEWRHQKYWLLFIQGIRFHVFCTKFSATYFEVVNDLHLEGIVGGFSFWRHFTQEADRTQAAKVIFAVLEHHRSSVQSIV